MTAWQSKRFSKDKHTQHRVDSFVVEYCGGGSAALLNTNIGNGMRIGVGQVDGWVGRRRYFRVRTDE